MKKSTYTLLLSFFTCFLFAGNFTPGNFVVVRVGDGTAVPSNAASAVFLEEYTPAGVHVQTVPLPIIANGADHPFALSGTATSEGELTLSADGNYLVLAGYDAVPGLASVSSDATTNRVIARIDASGTVSTSTGINFGTAYKNNNIRGVVSQDGTAFWCAGNGSSNSGGTNYVPYGSFTGTAVQVSSSITNTRQINIFGGQLYVTAGAGIFHGVSAVGTGLPVITGQTTAVLPGNVDTAAVSSPYGFYFADLDNTVAGVDVINLVDDRSTAPDGGLYKYSLVSGVWVSNGNIPNTSGLRGLAGSMGCSGSSVNLVATAETGVFGLVDNSGYNQPLTGALTALGTAVANTKIRGVAFAPGTGSSPLVVTLGTVTDATCHGAPTGSIDITVSGGSAPYNYYWTGGTSTQNLSSEGAGSYTVTVTDNSLCSATVSGTINEPAAIVVTPTVTNLPCAGGTNGAVNIAVSGGAGSFTYLWSANANNATTQNISGLSAAGTYTVTVTDASSCTVSAQGIVSQAGNLSVVPTITGALCFGQSNGAISVAVSGGTPTYTYAWTGGNTTANPTGLAAGSYSLTVTDNGGCTLINSYDVTQPTAITLAGTPVDASTHGDSDGAVNLTVTGGTPAYSYAWTGTASSQNLSHLFAGNYCVTVTDANSCTATDCYTVGQPAATGITESDLLESLNIYANSASIFVNAQFVAETSYTISLIDLTGNVIYTQNPVSASTIQTQIPVANVASGYYIVKISTGQGSVNRKLAIVK